MARKRSQRKTRKGSSRSRGAGSARARAGGKGSGAGRPIDPEMIRRATPSILVTLAAVGLVIGMVALVGSLESRAAGYRLEREPTIEIEWPRYEDPSVHERETWLPDALQGRIVARAREALGSSPDPFSIAPLRRLSRALGESGWFETEPRVERLGEGVVRVRGTWRTPAAVVRVGEREYLIDGAARRMPVDYPSGRDDQTTRAILGVRAEVPRHADGSPDYQTPWRSERIEAALALLEVLRPQAFWEQVRAIDVSEFGARGGLLVIVTDRGSRIEWGSRPDEFAPGEVSVRDKLARLASFYSTPAPGEGHIDAGRAGYKLYTPEIELPAR